MAAWDALNTKLIELGALDGRWNMPVVPHMRCAQYFSPKEHQPWMMGGDRNDYAGLIFTHNCFMSLKRHWRCGGGGRSITAQNNMMVLMGVIPQRAVTRGNFPLTPRPRRTACATSCRGP
jgi:hypothetical protein